MNSLQTPPNIELRRLQEQSNEIYAQLDYLRKSLETLGEKLVPVMRSPDPAQPSDAKAVREASPYSIMFDEWMAKLRSLSSDIDDFIRRIEL